MSAITPDNRFITGPRITSARFQSEMETVGSPWASKAIALYNQIVAADHDPAIWLAIGLREHRLLTDPNAVALKLSTNSWTNARSVRWPGLDHDIVTTADLRKAGITNRDGPYVRYRSVEDSLTDGMFRIEDPNYVYHQRHGYGITIGQALSIWTESDAVAYIAFVVGKLNEWNEGNMPPSKRLIEMFDHVPEIDTSQVLNIQDVQDKPNFPGGTIHLNGLTVHQTGNTKSGSNAVMHRAFVRNGGGSGNVSFHYAVDSEKCVQIVEDFVGCWHAGDGANGPGNLTTIAFELCINSDGDYLRTLYNAAYLLAIKQLPYADVGIYQHNHWSGKNCPKQIRERGEWEWFLQGVEDWKAKLDTPETEREINGYTVKGPFLTAYRQLEIGGAHWWNWGLPIGDQIQDVPVDGVTRTVQPFERGWVMTEGDGVVIAKLEQHKQIRGHIGIGDDVSEGLDAILNLAQQIANEANELLKASP